MNEETESRIDETAIIEAGCLIGKRYDGWDTAAVIGPRCRIRAGTIVYADCVLAAGTVTGVRVLIRDHTEIGERSVIGSSSIIEGDVQIDSDVVIQSAVYIPRNVSIGDRAFLGPAVVLTNDRYPLRMRSRYSPVGPVIAADASIGANATILPGVTVGNGAIVAAGAVVTHDVPPWTLAVGVPAEIRELPKNLREPNNVRRRA